jgi:hypothetical protein
MKEEMKRALMNIVIDKENLNQKETEQFGAQKKKSGQYIAVSDFFRSCDLIINLFIEVTRNTCS